ncbi:MAG TPA: hypothetical protein VIN57_01335, partial [Magnetovibrio sp.]
MKVAVIGSGQAAISCAEGLIERGIKPVVLDVGETLPADLQARADTLASSRPEAWAVGADDFPAPPQEGRLPKKTVFGSDYLYASDRPYAPLYRSATTAAPSFAKGGFSMGWGGAALPGHADDLTAWPFDVRRLDTHYAKALQTMPVAGAADGLNEAFPLHQECACPMRPTAQGASLMDDLQHARDLLNRGHDRVLFGAARLAVDSDRCAHCAMCLTGCPYGVIHTLDKALDRLIAAGSVRYQPRAYVVSLEEQAGQVAVNWIDTRTNDKRSDTFERVFVGAGALSSTRLVLNSMKAYGQSVPVIDSAKFAIPMLRLSSPPFEWPATNTLADLFIEAVLPEVSPYWLHAQISPLNDMMLQAMHMRATGRGRELNMLGKLARPLTNRMMVAWCALHSDLSSECTLSINRGPDDLPILNLGVGADRSRAYVRAYGRKLARMGLKFSTLFATPATLISPPGSTGHCGGSLPMRAHPQGPFESDVLGRPNGWRRIHLVDPS